MRVQCTLYVSYTFLKEKRTMHDKNDENNERNEIHFTHHVKEKQKNHKLRLLKSINWIIN